MAIDVLFYHSGMGGMPSATLLAAGGLTTLLDACLVDGMNSRAITSITRSGSTATVNFSGTNNFQIAEVVEVAGVDQSAYNGRFRVTGRAANSVSFTVVGTPTSPATFSSATVKHPAAGWNRLAISTNVAGYQTKAGSLGHWMQVEDANPFADAGATSRVRMASGLTGLDTGTQLAEQARMTKANNWVLVADGRSCYVVMGGAVTFMFGEFASYVPADAFSFFMNRGQSANTNTTVFGNTSIPGVHFPASGGDSILLGSTRSIQLLRGASQIGSDVNAVPAFLAFFGQATSPPNIAAVQNFALPSFVDGSIPVVPMPMIEIGTGIAAPRGLIRGLYVPIGRLDTAGFTNNQQRLDDVIVNGQVRSLVVCRFGASSLCQIAFDIGDSWDD